MVDPYKCVKTTKAPQSKVLCLNHHTYLVTPNNQKKKKYEKESPNNILIMTWNSG